MRFVAVGATREAAGLLGSAAVSAAGALALVGAAGDSDAAAGVELGAAAASSLPPESAARRARERARRCSGMSATTYLPCCRSHARLSVRAARCSLPPACVMSS
jgi:hypothetical protein